MFYLKHLFVSSLFLAVIFHEMGNLDSQEKAMVADWLSIRKFFSLIFSNLEKVNPTEDNEIYSNLLRKATIFTWLVFTLEFYLHDELHLDNIDESKSKKHLPNSVRFYYMYRSYERGSCGYN